MSNIINSQRLFSLSTFEGLLIIVAYEKKYPEKDSIELISYIEKNVSDGKNLDLEAAVQLKTMVTSSTFDQGNKVFYQHCIKAIIVEKRPAWCVLMKRGRKRFVENLETDEKDVFKAAGLMSDIPNSDIVCWWDNVAGHAKLHKDIEIMEQARCAERLTLEAEKEKLLNLGIEKNPEWKGLDDNWAGYDVLSYSKNDNCIQNLMIEVKSTIASPLRFYLSRNEWSTAEKVGNDKYLFHIWDMKVDPPILHKRTVDDISPHIPSDNNKGRWSNVLIPLGGSM